MNTSLILFMFIFIILIFLKIKLPQIKGFIGEKFLLNKLKKNLDENKYLILENVTLLENNDTTQIDLIILSVYGIFVIEVKNYTGWIFGSVNQKLWRQSIYKHKNKFQNPLHQNYIHIKFLEKLLNLDAKHLENIVVFVGDCELKTKLPDNVCTHKSIINYLKKFTTPKFTNIQIHKYKKIIDVYKLENSRKTNKQHIQNLKRKK